MNKILQGDSLEVLKTLESESVDCVITSPPYWGLRDYGVAGQLGAESTPEEYTENLVALFRQIKRVLKKEGTLWLNLGDSYAGSGRGGDKPGNEGKQSTNKGASSMADYAERAAMGKKWVKPPEGLKAKDLVGIPWRVAFALQADGWYLRQDIIWAKPNPMPESVTDRCTKSHEYIFLLSKNPKYYYDADAIKEKTVTRDYENRNKRSVWTVSTKPYAEAHFATFPENLIIPMVLAGCPVGGVVLDPFMGAGTTAVVAKKLNRQYLGIELNPEYVKIAEERIVNTNNPLF